VGDKMKGLNKINNHELLRDRIYNILKNKIIDGDLEEGSKITESEVANLMGVSKTPVREALKSLAEGGFVTVQRNKRMVIANISLRDIKEVYQIRAVLDGLGARLAAEKITHKDLAILNKILKKMEGFAKKNDIKGYSKYVNIFQDLIIKKSNNKHLETIINNLREKTARYRMKSLKIEGRLIKSFKEQEKIFKIIATKDQEQINIACQQHIQNALDNILGNKKGNTKK